jgi:two-component system catabolic regulation response regulator CreB
MRQAMQAEHFDVVVLDLMLPGEDGLSLCRWLRAESDIPILMLTARCEPTDRIIGLELGADDYMAKPFSPRELVARVRARLRRSSSAPAEQAGWQQHGRFAIDREGRRIRFAEQPLELTRYEYALMAALLQRPGAILSRAQLMDRGWDTDADSADRTVDTHVKTLRAKLRAAGADPDPIRTHRGLGYALDV